MESWLSRTLAMGPQGVVTPGGRLGCGDDEVLDFLGTAAVVGFPCLAFARQAGAKWVVRDTG